LLLKCVLMMIFAFCARSSRVSVSRLLKFVRM
jgi:hypothetical protein